MRPLRGAAVSDSDDNDDDDDAERAAALAEHLFNKLTELIDEEARTCMSIDAEKEPERAAAARSLWGKALLGALAQQLGIVEAALIIGAHVPEDLVREVREEWIRSGHQACVEALEAQRADKETN